MNQIKFKDFVTLQRGFDLPRSQMVEGEFPVVGSTSIIGYHNEYKKEPPGVITGRSGSLGVVQYITSKYWPHNTSLWVKDFKGNHPRYVYYLLKTLPLASYNAGVGVPTLNRNHLDNIDIKTHDLPNQYKVASVLSAYDDLIENNARRIKILEEMCQRIYREWFVDFRFPGHEKVKFVDSRIGRIPSKWNIVKLSTIVETQYGYTESTSEEEIGPKFLRGMDINKSSFIDWSTVPYCKISDEDLERYRLAKGDIVIIRMADPGKVGIVERNDINAVFASYLIRLKIKTGIDPYYLFYFLLSDRYQGYITGASTGTTRKSASAGVITNVDFLIPETGILNGFVEIVSGSRSLLNKLIQKNEKLRVSRDILLPKLISGEIDVSQIDIAIQEQENVA